MLLGIYNLTLTLSTDDVLNVQKRKDMQKRKIITAGVD